MVPGHDVMTCHLEAKCLGMRLNSVVLKRQNNELKSTRMSFNYRHRKLDSIVATWIFLNPKICMHKIKESQR